MSTKQSPKPHSFVSLPLQSSIIYIISNNYYNKNSFSYNFCNAYKFSTCNILYSDVDPEDDNYEVEDGNIFPEDGYCLDRTQFIVNKYHQDKDGLDKYFQDKENAIKDSYRQDSNSAAAEGVQASELQRWMEERDSLLEDFKNQKDDAYDLADIPVDSENTEQASDIISSNEGAEPEERANYNSLIDGFADPFQDMLSYIDPED